MIRLYSFSINCGTILMYLPDKLMRIDLRFCAKSMVPRDWVRVEVYHGVSSITPSSIVVSYNRKSERFT